MLWSNRSKLFHILLHPIRTEVFQALLPVLLMRLLNCCCGAGCCGFNCLAGMLLYPPLHSDVSHWHTDVASPCWCQPQMGLKWKFHGLLPQWDLILLPHPGCCSLLPTAPVVSILDSSTAADPAILVHLCMHAVFADSRINDNWWHHSSDDVGSCSCSASGATSFTCAYCQASPAALVPSPSLVASLSTWNHPILTSIHGDTNFPRVASCFILPCFSRISIDLRSTRTESKMWGKIEIIDYRRIQYSSSFVLSLGCFAIRLMDISNFFVS